MYEGPIKAAGYAPSSEETPILRQLRWTDLVARIAATRDSREAVPPEDTASFASFHAAEEKGQRAVNRDALTDGKMPRLIQVDTTNGADSAANGDRETE